MRFLHTADLHIGKVFDNISMLEDQKQVLRQITDIAVGDEVDAVLIAGDVYQRSAPQAEAMEVFDGFVSDLTRSGKKVFLISGNHDSAQRISYFSSLIRGAGVYATEEFGGRLQSVKLTDEFGDITVHLLPFIRPTNVRPFFADTKINSYTDAVKAVLDASDVDERKRNVLLVHQFVTGAEAAGSEELSVGGVDNVDASVFDKFDYVAMGHIHKSQKIARDTVRYAGSPMKYSFGEAEHLKSVTIVDMGKKGDVSLRTVPLSMPHDVRKADGMLDELLSLPYSEDYIWATIHDELVPPDAQVSLTTVFSNLCKFSVVNSKTKTDIDVLAREEMEGKSVTELFSDFYMLQNNGVKPDGKLMETLDRILTEMEEKAR